MFFSTNSQLKDTNSHELSRLKDTTRRSLSRFNVSPSLAAGV